MQDFRWIGNGLAVVHMRKTSVMYNRPLAVGVAILDISKTFMYDFHYNVMKKRYGEAAELLFTDTDSLAYSIQTRDVYADMREQLDLYDTSEYPSDHPCHSLKNKKVVLKMKDEFNGEPIREYWGLRSKMYCIVAGTGIKATAKGIKKSEGKKLTAQAYAAALAGETSMTSFSAIRSRDHNLLTLDITKVGLCAFDDKRYVLEDNIHTLAHGHAAAF